MPTPPWRLPGDQQQAGSARAHLLDTTEAARYLRIRLSTFRNLIRDKGGHRTRLRIKIGDRAVILAEVSRERQELLQWLGRGPIVLYQGQRPVVVPGPFWQPVEVCPVMEDN